MAGNPSCEANSRNRLSPRHKKIAGVTEYDADLQLMCHIDQEKEQALDSQMDQPKIRRLSRHNSVILVVYFL